MIWARTDPVQWPVALLWRGEAIDDRLVELARKPALFDNVRLYRGTDWLAVFGEGTNAEDVLLPRIDGAIGLYKFDNYCWQAVGTELAVPEAARVDVISKMRSEYDLIGKPYILVPVFENGQDHTGNAHVYQMTEEIRVSELFVPESVT